MSGLEPEHEIEDLLNQVEETYFASSEARKLAAASAGKCECNTQPKPATNWEEVEDLLKEFTFEDSNPYGKNKNKSWARQELPQRGKDEDDEEQKCYPIYLSGSYEIMGVSEPGCERPCNMLKCLRCDFDVVYFDNYAWDPSTDYLFLRNNMPDFNKLACKLLKKKGTRAYACQCHHMSVNKITNTLALAQIRWVCRKHPKTKQNK